MEGDLRDLLRAFRRKGQDLRVWGPREGKLPRQEQKRRLTLFSLLIFLGSGLVTLAAIPRVRKNLRQLCKENLGWLQSFAWRLGKSKGKILLRPARALRCLGTTLLESHTPREKFHNQQDNAARLSSVITSLASFFSACLNCAMTTWSFTLQKQRCPPPLLLVRWGAQKQRCFSPLLLVRWAAQKQRIFSPPPPLVGPPQ